MSSPQPQSRPVRLLAAGGTISMQGERAVPRLNAAQLVEAVPELAAFPDLTAETALGLPGPHITLDQALTLAQRAADLAAAGSGVVITSGTDTLEEIAMLCALQHRAPAPIVLTGANRTASAPGADGPANLLDAVTLAAAAPATGLGAVVVFGGEIHAAATVRKTDSTGPRAFSSPVTGPVGRVVDGRVWLHTRPAPPPHVRAPALPHRVDIVTAALGDDGALLAAAAEQADGLVVVAFGAGHLTPGMLHALRGAAQRIPVVITVRPERGSMAQATYGFEGSERDLRASGAVCAPFLSAPAARMALLCCLGAGRARAGIAAALAPYDA